ncbi:hypothetical protein [Arthrobacter roseus]|uniref:hypothetical protein n=1 Tax=Arthrobacter roseus TaxID=136274 RepID=UPI001EF87CAC|nr:hypothetical protein [Arthrobacter roseus]MBM7847426.1 hypothetical protein [Arthrobacter roseus]
MSESDAFDVSRSRLRSSGLLYVARGIRAASGNELQHDDDGPAPRVPQESAGVASAHVGAFTRVTSHSAASHRTAGAVWGLFHYTCQGEQAMIHISRPEGKSAPRRTKVIGHCSKLYDDEITTVDGIRVTTRERTWLDLAEMLSVDELVVVVDQLIRVPRLIYEGRYDPYCTKADLQAMIDRHPGKRGIRTARASLELGRVGSDSPPETMLRLALDRAGLPTPQLNVAIVDPSSIKHHEPDISYADYLVCVEYEGAGHNEERQVDRDIGREERCRDLGWTEVRISKRHMANDARAAVIKVRDALIANGWRP